MKRYLLFDRAAMTRLIGYSSFQSVDKSEGKKLIEHFLTRGQSEIIENVVVEYLPEGILFTASGNEKEDNKNIYLFCVDLTTCNIMKEESSPNDLLTVMQKSFRLAIKIWERKPFSQSERIYESKSILFPFVLSDRRRMVIERSNHLPQFEKNHVEQPLLAYKYSAEDPATSDERVDVTVLANAIKDYLDNIKNIKKKSRMLPHNEVSGSVQQMNQVATSQSVESEGFRWMGYEQQYKMLTDAQKSIVDFEEFGVPIRIEGPAGTGKTIAMVMRAYRLLCQKRDNGETCHIIFFSHNESTRRHCYELFASYFGAGYFLSEGTEQSICFTTLLEYCRSFAEISPTSLIESTPESVKDNQLQLIASAVEDSRNSIRTFRPHLSDNMRKFFDASVTPLNIACKILQHEFSIQIKGRTDSTIERYKKIRPIKNGLPYDFENKKDQELIFLLFSKYQSDLGAMGVFDADDVIMEALARLNAPVWRRERQEKGFDMVFVDEMHLFNLNEQSVFHFLTKKYAGSMTKEGNDCIPICFALDYGQAIGDQGDIVQDYLTQSFKNATLKNLNKVFRNSPVIIRFCESIAASGTLMFQEDFRNPYDQMESRNEIQSMLVSDATNPILFMYEHEDAMLRSLKEHIDRFIKDLHCKPSEIAVIDFSDKVLSPVYLKRVSENAKREFNTFFIDPKVNSTDSVVLASPYDINGLEFTAVILLNVDAGYVPQKAGVSDISKHFVTYSAYNLLYIAASRAVKQLVILGNKVNGISSCLEHAISNKTLDVN